MTITTVHLFETTIAAPDLICFEIRDQNIVKGGLSQITANPPNGWKTINGVRGEVVGPNSDWFRAGDTAPTNYLDRNIIDSVSGWNTANPSGIGGKTITGIYRKSWPYDQGYVDAAEHYSAMRHYVYVQLSGNLPQGTYTINFPSGSTLAATQFTFNDKMTRAHSIRVTQVGHRPNDDSKLGYLSLWVPGAGTDGSFDFINTYGLTKFFVRDSTGHFVGGQFQIVQRGTPTTDDGTLQPYGVPSMGIRTISAVTYGSAAQITTASNHGFSGGETIRIFGMGTDLTVPNGSYSQFNGDYIVGLIISPTVFALLQSDGVTAVNSTSFTHWVPNCFDAKYDSKIEITRKGNRANTYTFNLDFSSIRSSDLSGTRGPYYIWIPGLGISYPFDLDDGVWYRAAQAGCAGFYHQCQGIAKDGRYGYTAPAAFVDGAIEGGVERKIYWSTMGAMLTGECQYGGGTAWRDLGMGAYGPYLTTTRATGIYGGWKDGGDWTVMLQSHADATYQLLATHELVGSAGAPASAWNFPRMSAVLDPTLYAGTDGLPDLVHAAMWEIDFYRRTQILWNAMAPAQFKGGVASVIGYGSPDPGDGAADPFEPSWISTYQAFLGAPDHSSNYAAAFLFAKAALVFKAAGFTGTGSLTDVYTTAATDAWTFAENMYGNAINQDAYYNGYLNLSNDWPQQNGNGYDQAGSITCTANNTTLVGSGTSFTTQLTVGDRFCIKYIPGVFTVASVTDNTHVVVTVAPTINTPSATPGIHWWKLGISGTTFTAIMSSLEGTFSGNNGTSTRYRFAAAGTLFRLTGTSTYGNIVIGAYDPPAHNAGVWEYGHAVGANPIALTTFINGHGGFIGNTVIPGVASSPTYYALFSTAWGIEALYNMWVYNQTTDATLKQKIRKYWQNLASHLHGANQYGYCFCSGIGQRNVEWGALWRDREGQGIKQPMGMVNYLYVPSFGGLQTSGFNFAIGDSPINFTVDFPPAMATTPNPGKQGIGRSLWPYRLDVPQWELILENSFDITCMEFTTEQTVIPHWSVCYFLSSLDGNDGANPVIPTFAPRFSSLQLVR